MGPDLSKLGLVGGRFAPPPPGGAPPELVPARSVGRGGLRVAFGGRRHERLATAGGMPVRSPGYLAAVCRSKDQSLRRIAAVVKWQTQGT
ncbi:MAG: hypothetical protein RIT19_2725 [Verrucomicrobiota bacterium]